MALRAGGGYLRLRRALGVPAPVQGLRARGARLSGARLAAPITGTVLQFARDGALRLQIGASAGFVLVAEAGVFTLAGQDAALLLARRLVAEPGVFSLAGQDAALLLARRLVAEPGVFALAGQDVDLRLGSAGFVLVAEAGVFSLAGQDAALLLARRLEAEAGAFALAGQDVALLLARRLLAEAGVFSLAGQDVDFVLQTSDVAAFARALHRHAALARQGSDKAVLAVQVLAAAPKGRLSTKGVGRP